MNQVSIMLTMTLIKSDIFEYFNKSIFPNGSSDDLKASSLNIFYKNNIYIFLLKQ